MRLSGLTLGLAILASGFATGARADDWQLPWLQPAPAAPLSLLYCPNQQLAGRCGDGICDPGETATNCPYDCEAAPIKNWNGDLSCAARARVVAVHDPADVQAAVRIAASAGQHLRAVGARHSDNSLVCSDDVLIDMRAYQGIIGLETGSHGQSTVRVRGGTPIMDLLTWLYARGLMLEGYAVPAFREGTVAGMLATGSHGGSRRQWATLPDIVDRIEVVTATGSRQTYDKTASPPEVWRAATVGLGLLGIMTEVSLDVRPYRNLAVEVAPYPEADWLSGAMLQETPTCDWDIFYWAPRTHQVSRLCATETTAAADPLIENTSLRYGVLGNTPTVDALELGALSLAVCDPLVRCAVHGLAGSDDLFKGYFSRLRPDGTDSGLHRFVGLNHLVTTSKSGDLRRVGFRNYELAIAGEHVPAALQAIQAAVAADPCGLLGDFSVRFAPVSRSSWLGQNAVLTPAGVAPAANLVMYIEVNGYLPPGLDAPQRAAYDRFNNDLVRMLISRFQGRPHWGKGQSWVLSYAAEQQVFGAGWQRFLEVVRQADPAHLFQNELARTLGL